MKTFWSAAAATPLWLGETQEPKHSWVAWIRSLTFALAALALCLSASAAPAVSDRWDTDGVVAIEGEGWQVSFQRASGAVELVRAEQRIALAPCSASGDVPDALKSCSRENADGDRLVFRAAFRAASVQMQARISIDAARGSLTLSPGPGTSGARATAPIAIGVLPGRRLEDVLYKPDAFPDAERIAVPSENVFAGLMCGGNGIVACGWPEGGQRLTLHLAGSGPDRVIDAIEATLDGKELTVYVLAAPAIWYRRSLVPGDLEQEVTLEWRRPFPGTYKTQLPLQSESTTVRTFVFNDGRSERWSPEIGEHVLPVWFDGETAKVFASKRVPPKGELVVYPDDGGAESFRDFARHAGVDALIEARNEGRDLPPGPNGAPNVGFNACWGTFFLRRTLYTIGAQHRDRVFLAEHADFLADRVACVQRRNANYFDFIARMHADLDKRRAQAQAPDLIAYLDEMGKGLDAVEEGHRRKMDLYGETTPEAHAAHARRNVERIKKMLETPGPELYPEYEALIDELNRMSWGHDESTGMRFTMLVRAWAQDAALRCATVPEAVEYAREIRAAILDALNGAPPW